MKFKIFRFILSVFFIWFAVQLVMIAVYARKLPLTMRPFQKVNPQSNFKVLFAGDSTAVGTGASDNTYSTSGWLSRDFPNASIENYSKNGLRLKGLIEILSGLQGRRYDLAVLQIGANDIIRMTSLRDIEQKQAEVIRLAKNISDKVIILHSGDIGDVRMFCWPLTTLYTWRTLKVRDIYQKSQDDRVAYVDIYELEKTVKDVRRTYAPDQLHLNDEGYRNWYQFIKTKIK